MQVGVIGCGLCALCVRAYSEPLGLALFCMACCCTGPAAVLLVGRWTPLLCVR